MGPPCGRLVDLMPSSSAKVEAVASTSPYPSTGPPTHPRGFTLEAKRQPLNPRAGHLDVTGAHGRQLEHERPFRGTPPR